MNLFERYREGLPYRDFLERYATAVQKERWQQAYQAVALTDGQRNLLAAFTRRMPVLCLAGAWCGDCIRQCPIFENFAAAAPVIEVRYLDRDDHPDVQAALQVNGGDRVPVAVFFSDDGHEVARYGDRTLSQYRRMMREQAGDSCPTGLVLPDDPLIEQVTADWLREFERVQWLLRLSPRLRQREGD